MNLLVTILAGGGPLETAKARSQHKTLVVGS
jgi:hypothetical protein